MKLYVGNLSYEVTDEDLKTLFSQHGQVETAAIIKDRDSGRSKGFGFVELASKEEGQAAIDALNGKEFQGRNLIVNEARPSKGGFGSGSSKGGFGGNRGFSGGKGGFGGGNKSKFGNNKGFSGSGRGNRSGIRGDR